MPEMLTSKERTFVFQIAFPFENIGCNIPELLATVIGKISMAGKLKLLDIDFPKRFTKGWRPKFGMLVCASLWTHPAGRFCWA